MKIDIFKIFKSQDKLINLLSLILIKNEFPIEDLKKLDFNERNFFIWLFKPILRVEVVDWNCD